MLFRSLTEPAGRALHGHRSRLPLAPAHRSGSQDRSEEHTSELQSLRHLVCRLLLERDGDHRDLHSFPTRCSSDLLQNLLGAHCTGIEAVYRLRQLTGLDRKTDRKSTRLNSSHLGISYAVFCLKETATTEIYTLSLHDALPISYRTCWARTARASKPSTACASSPVWIARRPRSARSAAASIWQRASNPAPAVNSQT